MPKDTVKVDRTTPFGNPFVVGRDGTAAECVELHKYMLAGWLTASCTKELPDAQRACLRATNAGLTTLRGKNLACWCALNKPCHADTLLVLANA